MTVPLLADVLPIRQDEDGVLRVGRTRVAIDFVIRAFLDGAEPDTITRRYRALELADVYGVIAHYLNHRAEYDGYLHRRGVEADAMQLMVEAGQPPAPDLRARRVARMSG